MTHNAEEIEESVVERVEALADLIDDGLDY